MTSETARSHLRKAMVAIIILACALVATAIFTIMVFDSARDRSDSRALNLADRVEAACVEGSVTVKGRDICKRATEVQTEVRAEARPVKGDPGEPGPIGPRGYPGKDGRDGDDAATPRDGKDGRDGVDGVDGVDGKDGADGVDGEDSTIPGPPGPAGKDSTIPGPTGPSGPPGPAGTDGADGVGIQSMQCTGTGPESRWTITMTNGQVHTASGPCKAVTITPTP